MGIFDRRTKTPAADLFRTSIAEAWLTYHLAEYPEVFAATTAGDFPRVLVSDLRLVPAVRKAFPRVWIELLSTDAYAERLAQANKKLFEPSPLRDTFTANACAPERLLLVPPDPLLESARAVFKANYWDTGEFNAQTLLSAVRYGGAALVQRFLTQLFAEWSFTRTPAGVGPDGRLIEPVVDRDPPAQLVERARIFDWGLSSVTTTQVESQVRVEAATETDLLVLDKRQKSFSPEQLARLVTLAEELVALYESKKEPIWTTMLRHLKEQPRGYDLVLVSSYACAPNRPEDGAPDNLVGERHSLVVGSNVTGAAHTPGLAAALSARTLKHGVLAQYDNGGISVVQKSQHNTRAREWGIDL